MLNIPADHTVEKENSRTKGHLGQEEIDDYVQLSPQGDVVARHRVIQYTHIKGNLTTHHYQTFDAAGKEIVGPTQYDPYG